MTEKEKLLTELVPQQKEEVTVLEDNYSVASLKEDNSEPLSDVEMLVIGDYVSSVSREDIISKYGLSKPEFNKILKKQKSKQLITELREQKHEEMKSRLAGALSEGTEMYLDLIRDKLEKGDDVSKILFYLFGTSSLMDVYEKLGKMDKKDDPNQGNATFNFINKLMTNND